MTPKQLAKRHGRIPARETIAGAARRAATFARAMIDAGHGDELDESMRSTRFRSRYAIEDVPRALAALGKTAKPTAAAVKVIARADARYRKLGGKALPASVRELWDVLGDPAYGRWLRGFCVHALVDPKQLITPPAWANDSALACITEGDGVSDTRERFDNEYVDWFAAAAPKTKVSTSTDLARFKKPGTGMGVMLDPALVESIISIGWWHSEDWFVVAGLGSRAAAAPVFSNHDDGEGWSDYLAKDVRSWISAEVSASMMTIAIGE